MQQCKVSARLPQAYDFSSSLLVSANSSASKPSKQYLNMIPEDDLPPPYSTVPGSTGTPSNFSSTPHPVYQPQSQSSLFSTQLSGLRSQILEEQAARASVRDQQDIEILSLIVPHIEALLDSIASHNPPPTLVEATFVPDEAIEKGWKFSDAEQKRTGEVRELVRVGRHLKMDGDKKSSRQPVPSTSEPDGPKEFDEWGRWSDDRDDSLVGSKDDLWWSDEEMAHRLAKHLQPKRATASVDRQTVQAQVERNKDAKKQGRWNMFKKDEPAKPVPTASVSTPYQRPLDDVGMTVNAEEATFRKQNEMGIWESRTGWGLVVRVSIRR